MPRDYYNDAEEVAERLRAQGDAVWGDKLTRAIEEGFTSTEILMALRYHLDDLLRNGPVLDADTESLAVSLRSDIDAALS